uniref:Uncharacterized protein n=1 Tax=Glossina austeni TaxID=7395 RepID=A0A1A9VAQ3_GLOAU
MSNAADHGHGMPDRIGALPMSNIQLQTKLRKGRKIFDWSCVSSPKKRSISAVAFFRVFSVRAKSRYDNLDNPKYQLEIVMILNCRYSWDTRTFRNYRDDEDHSLSIRLSRTADGTPNL